jgi:glutamate-5-semialdehyde dehydrogenase
MLADLLATATSARAEAPAPGSPCYVSYCNELGARLGKHWDLVRQANSADVAAARERGLPGAIVDRLTVSGDHLSSLVALAGEVAAAQPAVTEPAAPRPASGASTIRQVRKPLGLVLMIYEARPTVTFEGALLPVSVGNAVILRGGAEIARTAAAFGVIAAEALQAAGLPAGMVHVLADPDRRVVRELLGRADVIDALIPRGSPSLIDYCQRSSTIPVIASGGGVNHLYVDRSADIEQAARLSLDSKVAEPTACNTLEMVLAHADIAADLVDALIRLGERSAQAYRLRIDGALLPRPARRPLTSLPAPGPVIVEPLADHDDGREFLDRTIGVRPVAGIEEAIAHIRRHGSGHTEGVAARDPAVIGRFLSAVDAAALVVNASLRMHDGPTMRLGPELSISTGRLHVRGPVGLSALMTYSWVIEGDGDLRGGWEAAGEGPP